MIGQTKKSLKLLNKNKNYFEDPNYFSSNYNMSSTFYNKNIIKYLSPNKNMIMSKSSSDFFSGDKPLFYNNNFLKLLQEKKLNLSKQLSSLLDNSNNENEQVEKTNKDNNLKKKKYYSLKDINVNSQNKENTLFNKIYKQSSDIKDSTLKNISRNKIKNNTNNITLLSKSNSFNIYNNNERRNKTNVKYLPLIKSFPSSQQILSPQGMTFYPKNINISTILKRTDTINIQKNNKDANNRINVKKSFLNESYNEKVKGNEKKKSIIKLDKNAQEIVIADLYDKLKDGKDLNKKSLKNIYKYIYNKKIKKKKKKDTINLIKDVQLLSDGFDINKVSKSIENIPNKEIKQIRNFKKINLELNRLDKKYAKDICEFKAKNQRNDGQEDY